MKLGVHIGYWGMGLSSQDQLEIVQEAERLGYDSVWAAEAYGSDTATVLGWLAGQTSAHPPRLGHLPDARPLARHDRDDGRHDRPALRRAHDPRHRLLRAAGRRGLARAALRQAAAAHARVRRGRAHGARPRTRRVPRRDARAAAARRAGQGAQAHDLPRAGAHPHLPRRDRAEEHRAGGRDRRRLDPHAVLPGARLRAATAAPGGRRSRRANARGLRHRADRPGVRHRRSRRAPATRCGRSSRCTSAAWARASRTSTTSSSAATASRPRPSRSRTSTSKASARRRWRRSPTRSSTPSRCAALPTCVRERLAVYRDAGVGTLGVTPIAFTTPERLEQLRLVAELASA